MSELKDNDPTLPAALQDGIEAMSGQPMDGVKVHRNSAKPTHLQGRTQGGEIHAASRQEPHLPHEAWHVVQQKPGRVKPAPTLPDGATVKDDAGLEQAADTMGARAAAETTDREKRDC